MHEMSLAESIMGIVEEELQAHDCNKLTLIRVRYGALSQVVPDSLQFCFTALIQNTPHQGAVLELEEVPVRLRCAACAEVFTPPHADVFCPCPLCGVPGGHTVEEGRELYVQHLEAE